MTGTAYLDDGVMPEGDGHDPVSAATRAPSSFRGSRQLARGHYFNDKLHEIISSNELRLAFVENIAMLYVNRGVEFPELIEQGSIGLSHALENLELDGASRSLSHAARCIRQHIERAIANQAEAADLPACMNHSGTSAHETGENIMRSREIKGD